MTPKDFQVAARDLAARLDVMPVGAFVTVDVTASTGHVALPEIKYDAIAIEWVEFLTPYRLDDQVEAYEAVARRGWDNAKRIDQADWDETVHIAASLIRAQRTRGGDIFKRAMEAGMLSGVLRRLATLSEGADASHFAKARGLFSASDTPTVP